MSVLTVNPKVPKSKSWCEYADAVSLMFKLPSLRHHSSRIVSANSQTLLVYHKFCACRSFYHVLKCFNAQIETIYLGGSLSHYLVMEMSNPLRA